MTATQCLNLYNIALKHFKNEEDASAFVKEIEVVVDNKFDTKKDTLTTKQDLAESKLDIIKWMVAMWVAQMAAIVFIIVKK
jgi:hypothetical protein